VGKWFERVALGVIMGAVAFVAERRLMKAMRRRGEEPRKAQGETVELSTAAPEQVDQ
jgi:flagellar biosynthesis/type III secretory pathway M-ring protein FliF/YscJ